MRKLFHLFPVLLLTFGLSIFPVASVFANDETDTVENELDISLSPTGTLFDISNMKPGDWAPRTITVMNSGTTDFSYLMSVQNNGDKKLFNELLLEIITEGQDLYQGKLAEFASLPARALVSGSNEALDITIRFPEHLGNDFQGLSASFAFTFTAEGKGSDPVQTITNGHIDSGGPIPSGSFLPATATNIFNMMLVGSLFVAGGLGLIIFLHFRRMKLAQ